MAAQSQAQDASSYTIVAPVTAFGRLLRQIHGQDLIEYALLAALIAILVSGAAKPLGTAMSNWFTALSMVTQSRGETDAGKGKKSKCSETGIAASKGKCQEAAH